MSANDKSTGYERLIQWSPYFIISCTLVGSFLVYYFQGEFPYEVFNGGLIITLLLAVIQVLKQKKAIGTDGDERGIKNVLRLFSDTSPVFLVIFFIALGVYTLLGNKSISLFYLWNLFFSYIWIVGISALIGKRK
ncbi:hypothetical protein [Carnobacterium sp.]|uniref:hypothetical protein n=1 Tax=Carnobacterium sp. TaxID=48221 RepID=UPI00388E0E13